MCRILQTIGMTLIDLWRDVGILAVHRHGAHRVYLGASDANVHYEKTIKNNWNGSHFVI